MKLIKSLVVSICLIVFINSSAFAENAMSDEDKHVRDLYLKCIEIVHNRYNYYTLTLKKLGFSNRSGNITNTRSGNFSKLRLFSIFREAENERGYKSNYLLRYEQSSCENSIIKNLYKIRTPETLCADNIHSTETPFDIGLKLHLIDLDEIESNMKQRYYYDNFLLVLNYNEEGNNAPHTDEIIVFEGDEYVPGKYVPYKIHKNYKKRKIDNIDLCALLDYSVEIVKRKPWSLEAFMVLDILSWRLVGSNKAVEKKCSDWLAENSLRTDEASLPYDLVYTHTISRGYALEDFYKSCSNQKFRALALASMRRDYVFLNFNCFETFIKDFPDHPAIPYVKILNAVQIGTNGGRDSAEVALADIAQKYKGFEMPDGWPIELVCYNHLAIISIDKRDFTAAKMYIDMIRKIEPEHESLRYLESELKRLMSR